MLFSPLRGFLCVLFFAFHSFLSALVAYSRLSAPSSCAVLLLCFLTCSSRLFDFCFSLFGPFLAVFASLVLPVCGRSRFSFMLFVLFSPFWSFLGALLLPFWSSFVCCFRLFGVSCVCCSRLFGPSFVWCFRLLGLSLVCCSRRCGSSFVCCSRLCGPSFVC